MTEEEKAAELAARDAVLSVPCPECKRPALARCVTLDTRQPTSVVHRARVVAWDKFMGPRRLAEAAAEAFERR